MNLIKIQVFNSLYNFFNKFSLLKKNSLFFIFDKNYFYQNYNFTLKNKKFLIFKLLRKPLRSSYLKQIFFKAFILNLKRNKKLFEKKIKSFKLKKNLKIFFKFKKKSPFSLQKQKLFKLKKFLNKQKKNNFSYNLELAYNEFYVNNLYRSFLFKGQLKETLISYYKLFSLNYKRR